MSVKAVALQLGLGPFVLRSVLILNSLSLNRLDFHISVKKI